MPVSQSIVALIAAFVGTTVGVISLIVASNLSMSVYRLETTVATLPSPPPPTTSGPVCGTFMNYEARNASDPLLVQQGGRYSVFFPPQGAGGVPVASKLTNTSYGPVNETWTTYENGTLVVRQPGVYALTFNAFMFSFWTPESPDYYGDLTGVAFVGTSDDLGVLVQQHTYEHAPTFAGSLTLALEAGDALNFWVETVVATTYYEFMSSQFQFSLTYWGGI